MEECTPPSPTPHLKCIFEVFLLITTVPYFVFSLKRSVWSTADCLLHFPSYTCTYAWTITPPTDEEYMRPEVVHSRKHPFGKFSARRRRVMRNFCFWQNHVMSSGKFFKTGWITQALDGLRFHECKISGRIYSSLVGGVIVHAYVMYVHVFDEKWSNPSAVTRPTFLRRWQNKGMSSSLRR